MPNHTDCASCIVPDVSENHFHQTEKGLSERVVFSICEAKNEPEWMVEYRLKALGLFQNKPMPKWGPDLSNLKMDDLCYYLKPDQDCQSCWDDVQGDAKKTFSSLGLPEIEKKYLGGLGAQYESETVYHNLKKEWEDLGIIFCDTDTALKKHPEIFKQYFGTVVPLGDNKFADLNSAVWSGGSFIYVPKGVHVTVPLQAYFRIASEQIGQFERTLIIADENSRVSYIEGCTAPNHTKNSLHSAVVEVIAKKGAKVKYYTIQNWSQNVYNLVTKRAVAFEDAVVEWIDANIGSGITMKYPAVILKGKGAKAEILSLALAGSKKQIQDSGAKAIHLASQTSSKIISKSISKNGGQASFRGKIKISKDAQKCKAFMQCDSLMIDELSRADAYPNLDVANMEIDVGHEARISKIADEQIFYLMSRGIDQEEAQSLIINGFIQPFVKELPMEYAIEINRLMDGHMKGEFDEK